MKAKSTLTVSIPPCLSKEEAIDGNPIRQVLVRAQVAKIGIGPSESQLLLMNGQKFRILPRPIGVKPKELALVIPEATALKDGQDLSALEDVRWLGSKARMAPSEVLQLLKGAFRFQAEDPATSVPGLRIPQLGALYAVLGYWTTASTDPATVVMPTGTGKTEAMLAVFSQGLPKRLLVVVPSDALRAQIAAKFESLGLLQEFAVVDPSARTPVVGQVRHTFKSAESAREFAEACNVVIATSSVLTATSTESRLALFEECTHLFIDEAHHVGAATWRRIRDEFAGKQVVQFTATPYREDGKHIGGRLIYPYPLREAQRLGLFSRINYISVVNFHDQDRAIASRAVEQLRADLEEHRDHLLMARVMRKDRATEILSLYRDLASDLQPVVLHSGVPVASRKAALAALYSRKSRIIICVDMLGEGFDLPELKIAAIHDPHKSLGVTLQFVGRFARVAGELGDATVVVGRPELDYDENLRRLYAEDADWNTIIRDLSETAVGYQEEISDFEAGFGTLPDEVSLRNLLPKMSTVVYRTKIDSWDPDGILKVHPEERLLTVPFALNAAERVAWFVTKRETQVRWGNLQAVQEVSYDLYVLYWDSDHQLLYINSSNTDSVYPELAAAVCGDDAQRITGEAVYRSMAGISRLVPTNVGVLDVRNRARRFSMHVGADVTEGFPDVEAQTKTQTNIFAYGYEDGQRASIGASLKGRVWSHRVAGSLKHWVDWCDFIGAKLTDDTISIDEVMRSFIRPKVVEERPTLVPLALEWPWHVYRSTTEDLRLRLDGADWPLIDTDLRVMTFENAGPIRFAVETPLFTATYELELGNGDMVFRNIDSSVSVVSRSVDVSLTEFLTKYGLTVNFEQDAQVIPPGILLQPDREVSPFDVSKFQVVDWTGVNLRKESQGAQKADDSVQARVIKMMLQEEDWALVIDDDGTGEIADVVAMRVVNDALKVRLVHCKYSGADTPGARVEDLYEVCGQAQKSVRNRQNMSLFFQHLIRRERRRKERYGRSGLEKGDGNVLYELEDRSRLLRTEFEIFIAQPGVSASSVSSAQLELLASTNLYVYETFNARFGVYCSS